MIYYKTNEEIELIRNSSLLVSKTLAEVASYIRPGIQTLRLDKIAEEFVHDNRAVPAFKGYKGFPASLCTSINEEVVHGIPGKRELRDGDIISIDCGVVKDEFYGDSAYTFTVGELRPEVQELLKVTIESLYLGIEQAIEGKRLGDVSYAIQEHNEINNPYGVVRELVGHGIGRSLHEEPEVCNYGKKGQGTLLKEGLVIAIEPMVNLGKKEVIQAEDGWTVISSDKSPSAHFEHTVAIGKKQAHILSEFECIEDSVKKNIEMEEIDVKK